MQKMSDKQIQEFDFKVPVSLALRKDDISNKRSEYRTEFMRDRDRVMYCSSFRRLSGKTQIYLTGNNDNQRNRLTHTLEVSQIARTIAHALKLDSNLTEAIALGHDLGHTPFGHAGERILNDIMTVGNDINIKESPLKDKKLKDSSISFEPLFGFKHNIQSVRVVAELEEYQGKYGLNLTNYTLWGILHHSSIIYKKKSEDGSVPTSDPNYRNIYQHLYGLKNRSDREAWSFEAFVVAQADEIAQWHHDLEDALRGGAMSGKEVCHAIKDNLGEKLKENSIDNQTLELLENNNQHVDQNFIADISQVVVNTLVNWLVDCSKHNLNILKEDFLNSHPHDTKNDVFFIENTYHDKKICEAIGFSKFPQKATNSETNSKEPKGISGEELSNRFTNTISNRIHHSRDVERMNAKGKYIIKKLFQAYYSNPQQLDDSTILQYMKEMHKKHNFDSIRQDMGIGAIRSDFEKFRDPNNTKYDIYAKILLMRKICDQISGMTDRYAISEYESLYG